MARALRRLRPTVRLRLTLLYSGLFIVSTAVLLVVTYRVVDDVTRTYVAELPGGGTVSGQLSDRPASSVAVDTSAAAGDGQVVSPAPDVGDLTPQEALDLAEDQHADRMRRFLVRALIAFGAMAILSVAVGWLAAGRALRNVRAITGRAREISASNLHERLALDGPDDELKELADTFDQVLGRLDSAFDAQRRFVANASHELRTPLARQRTLIQVALADPDATADELRAVTERVLAAGDEQNRLIDGLLTLARGQAGVDRRDEFDLATVAAEAALRAEGDAERHGVTIRTSLAPAPAVGDRRLVERLVANLVENAVHHNVDDGELSVATAIRDDKAVVTVSNTGPFVDHEQVDQIVLPFRRLGGERTGDGVGLGLSIVKAVADGHGADLDVAANPTGGLTISVAFGG